MNLASFVTHACTDLPIRDTAYIIIISLQFLAFKDELLKVDKSKLHVCNVCVFKFNTQNTAFSSTKASCQSDPHFFKAL